MVFRAVGLPVILADKNTPADIGRFLDCRLPFAPPDYGETCACLFRYISHKQHLHSADRVVGCTHRLCVSSRSVFSFHWLHAVSPVPMPAMLFLSFCLCHSCSQSFPSAAEHTDQSFAEYLFKTVIGNENRRLNRDAPADNPPKILTSPFPSPKICDKIKKYF